MQYKKDVLQHLFAKKLKKNLHIKVKWFIFAV